MTVVLCSDQHQDS